jgi:hypothetical protein
MENNKITDEKIKNLGVKIIGGFFVFRSDPSNSAPITEVITQEDSSSATDFSQKGEIIGIVLIKKYGTRTYMGYSQIDPTSFNLDAFITNFSGTDLKNPYDNNTTNVFDMDTLNELINKMIIQPVEITK